jgi:hypothetical protein
MPKYGMMEEEENYAGGFDMSYNPPGYEPG